jgi:hypothetical protein
MKSNYGGLKLSSATILLLIVLGIASLCLSPDSAYAGGTGWSVVPSPNASRNDNSLQAVAALSTNKIWAVGYSVQGTTKSTLIKHTLIEHYNGTSWHIVASPDVGTGDNVLTGIAAISGKNAWAVGSSPLGALILHFDGNTWHLVSVPVACQFNAVSAISANDIWAVGTMSSQSCAEHFNGTNWSPITTPKMGTSDTTLLGVSASSSRNVWAVGTYCTGNGCDRGGGSFQTLVLHYNGSRWSVASSPNPSSYVNQLNAVAVISATDVWAVGEVKTTPTTASTLIVHFDGIRWIQVVSPTVHSSSNLTAIVSASATNLFATGFSSTPNSGSGTLIEHFDGTAWGIVSSPSPGKDTVLHGLAHVPGAPLGTAQFWAVGAYSTTIHGSTLTERDI